MTAILRSNSWSFHLNNLEDGGYKLYNTCLACVLGENMKKINVTSVEEVALAMKNHTGWVKVAVDDGDGTVHQVSQETKEAIRAYLREHAQSFDYAEDAWLFGDENK
jgi:hypothetical protein